MMRSKLVMSSVALAVCALFLLGLFLVNERDELQVRASRAQGERIELGASLYTLHCRSCHGVTGEGVGQLGPALSDNSFFRERLKEVGYQSSLRSYILTTSEYGRMVGTRPYYAGNGKTMVMPPWLQKNGGPLRSDELNSITDFILNWEPTATGKVELEQLELPQQDRSDPEVIRRGEQVFTTSCSHCHRFKGQPATRLVGPDLSDPASIFPARHVNLPIEDALRESVLNPFGYIMPGYESQSAVQPCGAVLTRTELTALSAFLLH